MSPLIFATGRFQVDFEKTDDFGIFLKKLQSRLALEPFWSHLGAILEAILEASSSHLGSILEPSNLELHAKIAYTKIG